MSVRRSLRLAIAAMLYLGGGSRLLRRMRRDQVCVLCLHRVLSPEQTRKTNSLPGMILREQTFAHMLEYLQQHFEIITLQQFLASGASRPARPRCLITFDDGWKDNSEVALRWLGHAHVPAVIFLATGMIDSNDSFWVERLRSGYRDEAGRRRMRERLATALPVGAAVADLNDLIDRLKHQPAEERNKVLRELLPKQADYSSDQMLSWDEVREMLAAGIEFGGHTDSHPLLPYEDDATVEWELRTCKHKIEEETGKPARAFAYPNGDWDARVRSMVEQTGFECAFGTRPGWYRPGDDRFTIRRIMIHEGAVTGFTGRFSPAAFNLRLIGWR